MKFFFSFFSLISASSTLVCCFLPVLLVTLGAGGVMASLYALVPEIIWISQNKNTIFPIVAFILFLNGYILWKKRRIPCPNDSRKAEICSQYRKFSLILYFISLIIFAVGFFFAYSGFLFI